MSQHVSYTPETRAQILEQPLFLDPLLVSRWNRQLYEAGISKVKDLLYEVKDGFLPTQAIVDAVREVDDELPVSKIRQDYEQLKLGLPDSWLEKLHLQDGAAGPAWPELRVKWGDRGVDLLGCTTSMFYRLMVAKRFRVPVSEVFWGKIFPQLEPGRT